MPKLHQIIGRHWQSPNPFLSLLLRPLSKLFAKIAAKRRNDFVSGRLKSEELPIPVVVIGNIHADGTGKTPIVAILVSGLQKKDVKVGVISRGYGRKSKAVHILSAASSAANTDDEPLLLFHQTSVLTAVGSSRIEAGRVLLAAHPELRLVVTDGGLQHYALQRDMEIAVFPAADTGHTNLDLLSSGSLHEPLSRLTSVDAVVVNGEKVDAAFKPSENIFTSHIETGRIYRLNRPSEKLDFAGLENQTVAAIAGITKPERPFDSLRNIGITSNQTAALPNRADIVAADLPNADVIIITEEDAVKFSDGLNLNHVWVLPVCTIIEPNLTVFVSVKVSI